jgi:CRISPR-associated protein Cas4
MASPSELVPVSSSQLALELPAPPATAETPLVPVRMVNEYVYCPRLAFLEWVDGEWADSGDTEEGRRAHVRVDAGGGKLPAPGETEERPDFVARSVTLASEALGIIAKIDLVEGEDGAVTPVDTKKGRRPHLPAGAYEPERVQVCAQALILRDAGYTVAEGAIWYAGSRERVRIALDAELEARTRTAIGSCGSRPRSAACRRRSSTAPNAQNARSQASAACPTRSLSSAAASPRARSILRPTPSFAQRSFARSS